MTVISSKTDAMSIHNAHYQRLTKTGRVGAGLQFALCTKFLEAGVNFEFPAEIFYIFPQATDGLLQMLARPRIDRRVYSKTDLFKLYNTAVQTAGESLCLKKHHVAQNFGVVLRRFDALFEVACVGKNKYQIGAEITAKNVFSCQRSEESDLTTLTKYNT